MIQKKHALVLFTKSPQPGRTKTRLTHKLGGLLTEYEAALLYKVYDVGRCRYFAPSGGYV